MFPGTHRFRTSRRAGRFSATAVLVLVIAATAACRQPAELDSGVAVSQKVAVIGSAFDIQTINELIDPGTDLNAAIVDQLFLQLVDEVPNYLDGPSTFVGRLAESWEFAPDRKTLTFELRPGILWSDGTPVSAGDVRFTWQAQTHPDIAWAFAWIKDTIDDVEVVDESTVRFHFNQVSATQLADATDGVILPEHRWGALPFEEWRDNPQWFQENLVTNGPFLFGGWKPGETVTLERNDNYYLPQLPKLDRVLFRIVPDPSGLVSELLSGQVDMIRMPNPSEASRVENSPDHELIRYPNRTYSYVVWNVTRPLFQDLRVRRALAMGVDRQAIIDTLWFGYAHPATSPILSWIWPHDQNLEPLPYDPEQARRLLTEAGWIDKGGDGVRERDGAEARFELSTNSGNALRWSAVQMIQNQLADIGVAVVPRQLDMRVLSQLNQKGEFDATVIGLAIDTNHDLSYTFHTSASEGGLNFGRYSNSELDGLIETVNAALDKRDVEQELVRMQSLFLEDQPVMFLWEAPGLIAISKRLENVRPDALSEFHNLASWSIRGAD